MSVAFHRGQQLSSADLNIVLRSYSGVITDPYSIRYDVYRRTETNIDVLVLQNQIPLKERIGYYYAGLKVPDDWFTGEYFISWKIKDTEQADASVAEERFAVVDLCTQTEGPVLSKVQQELLKSLRNVLRDNNPERNYHFRPPVKKKNVKNFTTQFGFIWEDEELVDYLELALGWINTQPPATELAIDHLESGRFKSWRLLVVLGAAVLAIQAVALNWVADEFGYNISGVSLDLEKSSKYMQMRDSLDQRLIDMVTQAKSTIKITKGLRQSRYTAGFQSGYLGPGAAPGVLSIRNLLGRGWGTI